MGGVGKPLSNYRRRSARTTDRRESSHFYFYRMRCLGRTLEQRRKRNSPAKHISFTKRREQCLSIFPLGCARICGSLGATRDFPPTSPCVIMILSSRIIGLRPCKVTRAPLLIAVKYLSAPRAPTYVVWYIRMSHERRERSFRAAYPSIRLYGLVPNRTTRYCTRSLDTPGNSRLVAKSQIRLRRVAEITTLTRFVVANNKT